MNHNPQHQKSQLQPLSEGEQKTVDGGFFSLASFSRTATSWKIQSPHAGKLAPGISVNHNETLVEDAA